MIAVAATAIGLGFGLETPALNDVYPNSITWVVVTVIIGGLFTLIAILGFDGLSRFAAICAPWILVVFVAGAIASLPRLGVNPDLSNLLEIVKTKVWNGVATEGQEPYSFWHITFFAWFANLAMHIGLSDLALFRFAKKWTYGLYSSLGMYLGHFLAWICSGIMVAAIGREMNPGLMAFEAVGLAGAFAVLLAGWTTANPTLYRAGLALQTATPNWSRWKVTLAAGLATTILACFPVVFLKLLDYVAVYGLILMPVGAVVFAEFWILPRFRARMSIAPPKVGWIRWNVLFVWLGTLGFSFVLPVHLFFLWLPGYFFALVLYIILELVTGKRS
jgi:purine-cytosine permease-like protein